MKYHKPLQGDYESNLTAIFIYNVVDNLIKRNVTKEDVDRLRNAHGLGLGKLWTKPEVRSELQELVDSYIFMEISKPFKEVFIDYSPKSTLKKFQDYMDMLIEQYGSKDEAKRIVAPLIDEITKRTNKLRDERLNISKIKGKNVIKDNATDAFAHLMLVYTTIQLVDEEFKAL